VGEEWKVLDKKEENGLLSDWLPLAPAMNPPQSGDFLSFANTGL
jgi:hypothetical protein